MISLNNNEETIYRYTETNNEKNSWIEVDFGLRKIEPHFWHFNLPKNHSTINDNNTTDGTWSLWVCNMFSIDMSGQCKQNKQIKQEKSTLIYF